METITETGKFPAEIQAHADEKTEEKRRLIREGAATALAETKSALMALDEGETGQAAAALKRATGSLGLLLAREPQLGLAPVDIEVTIYDSYQDLESIEGARLDILNYLVRKEIQKGRELVSRLASEFVIKVYYLPLLDYYQAIKTAMPLLDHGEISEAKAMLQAALNTLEMEKHVMPLPVLRAEEALKRAEALAETADRPDMGSRELGELLASARSQLAIAEALGYGKKTDYEKFYRQIDEIGKKTASGKSGSGFFDSLMKSLADLRKSIFG